MAVGWVSLDQDSPGPKETVQAFGAVVRRRPIEPYDHTHRSRPCDHTHRSRPRQSAKAGPPRSLVGHYLLPLHFTTADGLLTSMPNAHTATERQRSRHRRQVGEEKEVELKRIVGIHKQLYPTGTYEGEYVEGKRQGRGKMSYACGEVYEGEWHEGKPKGACRYSWPSGLAYEGEWHRDIVIEGKPVEAQAYSERGESARRYEHEFGDGIYRGEMQGEVRHGLGDIRLHNGAEYTGQWHLNKKHGKGTYTWKTGTRYEGEFSNDKIRGQGIMNWIDGTTSTRGMPPIMLYLNNSKPEAAPATPKQTVMRRRTFKECSTMGTLCDDCRSMSIEAPYSLADAK